MDYYNQLTNANFASDYQAPDWWKSNFMLDQSPEHLNSFFASNPQYAQDFQNITSGGKSAYATDGTSLIKSTPGSMSQEAAGYYQKNPNDLLAAEGFGHDPTLSYMNYFKGPGSIGVNPKTTSVDNFLRANQWTPGGVVASNNPAGYAATPFGAGASQWRGGNNGASGGGLQGAPGQPATTGMGGYGGTSGSVGFTQQPGMNPYLQQAMDATSNNATQNWNHTIKPAIASQAMAAGGYGGSRQGVIESNSANDLNQGLSNALSNLAFNGYNSGLQYDLGLRNNALGFGNLDLGYANLDRTINNDNIANQMQGANLGLNVYDRLMQNNQTGLNAGTNIQNTPLNYWSQITNGINGVGSGYGTSTGTTNVQGNPLLGAMGGAQLGSQLGNWWSGGNSGTGMTGTNAPYQVGSFNYGLGNGSSGLGLRF
ncbi:MAG: hypothetical protein KGM60_10880 [Comamonadaceae bacterium]|nr:hypothetical protein [Comamonadaceae bacterium]